MDVVEARGPAGTSVDVTTTAFGGGSRVDAVVRNDSADLVALDAVELEVRCSPQRVLEHGYQSWSPVRRAVVGERLPERLGHPGWLGPMVRADVTALDEGDHAEQVLLTDEGVIGFLDGTLHYSVLRPTSDSVTAIALFDGVPLEPGEQRLIAPLLLLPAPPGAAWSTYASLWGQLQSARASTPVPRLGWCSWYHLFCDVAADDVARATATGSARGFELIALDDGYATVGDWLEPNERFPGGTSPVAARIAEQGMRPGIWTAPFIASAASRLVERNPRWVARTADGTPAVALHNADWGGAAYGLDLARRDVLDHLAEVYGTLAGEGWTWHKLDFVYGGALPGVSGRDERLTRAQLLHRALQVVRSAVGDAAFLLGCGAPLGPSVGLVDGMRVSGDTGSSWTPANALSGWDDVGPAARTALTASVLRAPFHRRLWVNDPDCVLIRQTELTPAQRAAALAVAVGAGGLVLVSDDLDSYTPAEWDELATVVAAADVVRGPFDISDPFAATVEVRGATTVLEVDWTAGSPALPDAVGEVLLGAPAGTPASRLRVV